MKLIAHRGNLEGPDPSTENQPTKIEACLDSGYDVEVDVWYDDEGKLWLGHDAPQYEVTWWWLAGKSAHLWVHCKDFRTFHEFSTNTSGYNYFFHQGDDYTLTSKEYIWSSPGKSYTNKTVRMIDTEEDTQESDCYAICSDYVGRLQ